MKGRRPKPLAVHRLHGTIRKDRHTGATPSTAGRPDCPDHLDEGAQAEWARVTHEMEAIGTLASADRALIATYCVLWSRLADAERQINALGQVIKTPGGAAQINPYTSVALRCAKELRSVAAELGLSPTSRTRLRIEPPRPEGKFAEFLNRSFVANRVRA